LVELNVSFVLKLDCNREALILSRPTTFTSHRKKIAVAVLRYVSLSNE